MEHYFYIKFGDSEHQCAFKHSRMIRIHVKFNILRVKVFDRKSFAWGCLLWNELPQHIHVRDSETLVAVKHNVKILCSYRFYLFL